MALFILAVVQGEDRGNEHTVDGQTVIGRDPSSDLVLTDPQVSARHAALEPGGQVLFITDLGSSNGTFVNDTRIAPSQPAEAKEGDSVELGATVIEVRREAVVPTAPPVMLAASQLTGPREIPRLPVLVFTTGQMAGTELPSGQQIVVGRDAGVADVILDRDTDVSRRHAAFSPAAAGVTVQDLGSTNGTFVNGHRLVGTRPLSAGDQVQIGSTTIEIRLPSGARVEPPGTQLDLPAVHAGGQAPNDIVVENLVKQFGTHRAVDGINLNVKPAEIYGFLGPNGAGKSTTVHMLVTLMSPTSGTARIAGLDVVADAGQIRSTIGVALQAAALDNQLNSWEHMALQTALHNIPRARRKQIAEVLIERVGLTYAADRLVGGYSGGMKRRLDLALALVHSPRVLFLDEPTTGLDPQSRNDLWEEVARLVREEGMTVFLTTQYLEEADLMADRVGIIDHGELVAENTPAALKAEIGRPTVEVLPVHREDFGKASEVLGRYGEVTSSTGGGVAARLRPGSADLAAVIRGLDEAGVPISNVEVHQPTLDDVFLAKTGRSIKGASEDAAEEESGVLDQVAAGSYPTPARGSP